VTAAHAREVLEGVQQAQDPKILKKVCLLLAQSPHEAAQAHYAERRELLDKVRKAMKFALGFCAVSAAVLLASWVAVGTALRGRVHEQNDPNPSIERTHNGGAQYPDPSRVVPPLCAAHVKR
jgi:hypothetical protein